MEQCLGQRLFEAVILRKRGVQPLGQVLFRGLPAFRCLIPFRRQQPLGNLRSGWLHVESPE